MKHGLFIFPTDYSIDPGSLAWVAEEAGFESIFFPDHTHIPASRITPLPGGTGDLGREWYHSHDLFVAMTAAAAATTKLLVGSGICLLAQRDPIICAKELASIDHLFGGRVVFGVGGGWNIEEAANHGIEPAQRFSIMLERIEAVKAIWTQDEASYHGRHVNFDRIWSWPKPVQKPGPPVLLAGNGPKVVDRVLSHADGWCPLPFPGLVKRIDDLNARAKEMGRPVTVSVFGVGVPPDVDELRSYRDAGVERIIYLLPSVTRAEVEPLLEAILAAANVVDAG